MRRLRNSLLRGLVSTCLGICDKLQHPSRIDLHMPRSVKRYKHNSLLVLSLLCASLPQPTEIPPGLGSNQKWLVKFFFLYRSGTAGRQQFVCSGGCCLLQPFLELLRSSHGAAAPLCTPANRKSRSMWLVVPISSYCWRSAQPFNGAN